MYTIEIKLALTGTRLLQIKVFILISMATPNNRNSMYLKEQQEIKVIHKTVHKHKGREERRNPGMKRHT